MANDDVCRSRILSEEYMDFIIPKRGIRGQFNIPADQLCVQDAGSIYDIVYVDRAVAEPISFDRFSYNSVPLCYGLLDMETLNQAGISQVQNYPTLQLMGEGILIGFVDTGIDYSNSVFRKLDGTTRIVSIWDQTVQTGTPPEEFYYGSVYTEEMINEALISENYLDVVPSVDENGHGTFLASVAAGGADVGSQFLGAAPESSIAVVKLKEAKQYLKDFYYIAEDVPCYQENDILLALKYLVDLAEARNMPLVLCVALGSSLGGHSGTSPLPVMMEIYANILNRGIVTGVGNEASQRHHFFWSLDGMDDRKEVEIRVGEQVDGFVAELWAEIPNLVTISLISPSGEQIPRISLRQGNGSNRLFQFIFEQTEVYVDNRILVEGNNSQLIYFRFANPAQGIWKIVVEPIQLAGGEFHIWLPMSQFLRGEVYFLEANPDTTLTCPSSANSVISAAYYNGTENSVDINSGRGYTRVGRIKPDFAAPGVNVLGALPGGRFTRRSGSSVSIGITAGAAALLMEWIIFHTNSIGADTVQLKNLMILGTSQRANMEYPNREWGYGTLDLYRTLDRLRQL